MKMEHNPPTPKEEIPNQLQNPLERRRLQNRLSQRNHRRKIRDRIAKLQERVIANELRAAAALNGWDQQYIPSPLPRKTHTALSENDLEFISQDVSPLGTEPSTPFIPSYPIFSSTSWPSNFNAFPTGGYHGELPPYFGGGILTPSNGMPPSTTAGPGEDAFRDTMLPSGEALLPDSLSVPQGNQPSYYVATEAALPQILQVINTMSPQSKIIVLVPPESPASACIPSFPPSNSYTGFENPATSAQQAPPRLTCLCYPQNIHSRSWMDAGSYMQECPITY